MKIRKKVPTEFGKKQPWDKTKIIKSCYIEYGKEYEKGIVYLIELNRKGNTFYIQHEGVACKQYQNKGFLIGKFVSSNKYFNPNFWYKLYRWILEDENLLYFDHKDHKKIKAEGDMWYEMLNDSIGKMSAAQLEKKFSEKRKNKIHQEALNEMRKYAIPSGKVLNSIIKIASRELNVPMEKKGDKYGKDWSEALVPVKVNGKDCILTWANCD